MVLFLREDYPITHAVLDKLSISARNAAGNQTIPNLVQLFDIIFAKNRENFEYLVSLKWVFILMLLVFHFGSVF